MYNNENKKPTKPIKGIGFIFNQRWIITHLFFICFIALLGVIYIANGHAADKAVYDIKKLETEIKFLQYEYKTIKADELTNTVENEVFDKVKETGLNLNKELPVIINKK